MCWTFRLPRARPKAEDDRFSSKVAEPYARAAGIHGIDLRGRPAEHLEPRLRLEMNVRKCERRGPWSNRELCEPAHCVGVKTNLVAAWGQVSLKETRGAGQGMLVNFGCKSRLEKCRSFADGLDLLEPTGDWIKAVDAPAEILFGTVPGRLNHASAHPSHRLERDLDGLVWIVVADDGDRLSRKIRRGEVHDFGADTEDTS